MNVAGGSVKRADDAGRRHRWRCRRKRKDGAEVVGSCRKWSEAAGSRRKLPEVVGSCRKSPEVAR